jgi:FecR protein
MNLLKQLLAGPLCVLLCSLPVQANPQAAGQHAGQINALIPAATRNAQPAKVQDELQWNDLLKTAHSGRVRAGLEDGSILSLGSDSELRIVQHDSTSQQTSLEMNFGKVRSQVVKIAKPGGKFEVTTPNAVIGVIGTDFYVAFEKNKTTVICYEGKVSVTPKANAQAQNNSGQANGNSILVGAGQMVVILSVSLPGGFQTVSTPPAVQQSSQLATDTNATTPPVYQAHTHVLRNLLIGSAIAVGLSVGLAVGTGNTTPKQVGTAPFKPVK